MRVSRLGDRRLPTGVLCVAVLVLVALPGLLGPAAAEGEAHKLLKGFQRSGQYVLLVGGSRFEDARIYHSRLAASYLILHGPFDTPILISPRTRMVQKADLDSLVERPDGLIYFLAEVKLEDAGRFNFASGQVAFAVDGRSARLSPTPPLIGLKNYDDVVNHTPEFIRDGKLHTPDAAALERLKSHGGQAQVLVVFGSWCPSCRRHLPLVLRVNKALSDTNIQFHYHGLPRPPAAWRDQTFINTRLKKLPAIVVTGPDGRVLGTMSGAEVGRPAARLAGMLR